MLKLSELIKKFNSNTPNRIWMSKDEVKDYIVKTCAWVGRHYVTEEDRDSVINTLTQKEIRIKEDTNRAFNVHTVEPIDGIKSIKGGWTRILKYKLFVYSSFIPDGFYHYTSAIEFSYFDNKGPEGNEGHTMIIKTGLLEDTVYKVDENGTVTEYKKNTLFD